MGQYWLPVNLDKKEYIHAHGLGDGLKLCEFGYSAGGVMTALAMLLSPAPGRGGGDWHVDSPLIGRWAGDRIVFVGDYAEDGDYEWNPETDDAPSKVYGLCSEGDYVNLTEQVRDLIVQEGLYTFRTADWGVVRERVGYNGASVVLAPDLIIRG